MIVNDKSLVASFLGLFVCFCGKHKVICVLFCFKLFRYVFNDDGLPQWFVKDEQRHCKHPLPVSQVCCTYFNLHSSRRL